MVRSAEMRLMSAEVRYCFDDEDIGEVLRNMGEIQVRRLPVLNRDKRLVGMISIGDLAKLIGRLEGKDITIESEAQRQRKSGSEVERLIADDTLVRELVPEWRPEIDLEEGLRRTIEWQRQRGDFRDAGKYIV